LSRRPLVQSTASPGVSKPVAVRLTYHWSLASAMVAVKER
jgi:hypothetical protein